MTMNPLFLLASSASAHSHSFMDALPYMAGMVLVLVSLACLWGITAICARILAIVVPEAKVPVPAGKPAALKPASTNSNDGIPPQIVAVISAAVATVCDHPVRIVSIKSNTSGWEQAGRRSVLSSHRIR